MRKLFYIFFTLLVLSFYGITNKNRKKQSNSYSSDAAPGPTKKDGTLDMRYAVNKEYVASNSNGLGPTKQDGTLDMRYAANKQYVASTYDSADSGCSTPSTRDGSPERRDSCNKGR